MVLPLLLLILLGCLDLGRVFSTWLTMTNGTREGARYACLFPDDTSGITEETQAEIVAAGLSLDALQIQVSTPQGRSGGLPVVVSASYSLPMITSFLFGGQPLTIRASTQMAIVSGAS